MAACITRQNWGQMRKRACATSIIIGIFNVFSTFQPGILNLCFQIVLIVDLQPRSGLLRANGGRLLHGRRHICLGNHPVNLCNQGIITLTVSDLYNQPVN